MKNDYTRSDGTRALFLSVYINGDRKRLPLDISVPPKYFDKKNRRVKNGFAYAKDYNLLLDKILADINAIEVNYRLSGEPLTLERFIEDFKSPSLRINFNEFASVALERQNERGHIKASTYGQQLATLNKIKEYQDPILFADITADWLLDFRVHLKKELKNKPPTIEGTIKNFKKFLHLANENSIKTPLKFTDIKVKSMVGEFTFLLPQEVKALFGFYNSEHINTAWKNILQRYLFSCFTGLRISDIEQLHPDNFTNGLLVFTSVKNDKFQRIQLNNTAMSLVVLPQIFNGNYSREHINRELKEIAKAVGIKKRLYYHSSRHTFATNYLISGGQIQNLQKLMGHSKIETTMVYAHVVDSLMNEEIGYLDGIVNL